MLLNLYYYVRYTVANYMRFIMSSVLRIVCFMLHLPVALYCNSEFKIDASSQVINQYSSSFNGSGNFPQIVKNNTGAVVWMEPDWSFPEWFYWSEETGVLKISEDPELKKLEAMTANRTNGNHLVSSIIPIHLDDEGNLFFKIAYKSNESKAGVWNKIHGFKFIDIQGFQQVNGLHFCGNKIIATGCDDSGGTIMAVVNPSEGIWPWESKKPVKKTPDTTPWDALPFGKYGARVHIIQQLLKSTKSADDKKIIMLMCESEIGNMLDLMQYDLKRAQSLIKKARSEGKVDLECELLEKDAKKHMTALQSYIKTLPKANKSRVDAMYLPSKDWSPKP